MHYRTKHASLSEQNPNVWTETEDAFRVQINALCFLIIAIMNSLSMVWIIEYVKYPSDLISPYDADRHVE